MTTLHTKSIKKIREAIDFLNNNRRTITVQIEGEAICFASKIVKVDHGDFISRGIGEGLVIDWLSPQKGNDLIQSRSPIRVRFSLGKSELPIPQHSSTRSGWICLVVPKESVHVFRGIASTYSQAKRPG